MYLKTVNKKCENIFSYEAGLSAIIDYLNRLLLRFNCLDIVF